MSNSNRRTWQSIENEIIARITSRTWQPGDLIPTEAELALEFGCARATVNRAMRQLAETGLLERRRKAGTRVALNPVRKAALEIQITRHEVENRGGNYRHALLEKKIKQAPLQITSRLGLVHRSSMLHLRELHLSDNHPFLYEDRWVNLAIAPNIEKVDLEQISSNEWLVNNAPFTNCDITLSAQNASKIEAEMLATPENTSIFIIDRITWIGASPVTCVRLAYAPGYRLQSSF